MDGGAWWAAVHGVAKESDMTERLHFHFLLSCIGEGNGNPLQCSCLENPRDGGAWWAAVCGVAQSQTRLKRLSSSSYIYYYISSTSDHQALDIRFWKLGTLAIRERRWVSSPGRITKRTRGLGFSQYLSLCWSLSFFLLTLIVKRSYIQAYFSFAKFTSSINL